MDRREFLRTSGLGLVGFLVGGCKTKEESKWPRQAYAEKTDTGVITWKSFREGAPEFRGLKEIHYKRKIGCVGGIGDCYTEEIGHPDDFLVTVAHHKKDMSYTLDDKKLFEKVEVDDEVEITYLEYYKRGYDDQGNSCRVVDRYELVDVKPLEKKLKD